MCKALPHEQSAAAPEARPVPGALSYTVFGMGCGGCKAKVTEAVSAVDGVEDVRVDLDALRLTVSGQQVDDRAVRAAVVAAGYELEPVT